MGTKSKLFRVFVEGNTISDGRKITPEMIDQCAETFNAETYSPRINVEHISGYSPEPPFNGYGTVIALEARDVELTIDGKKETRRALYAQVDGNDQLVDLAKRDQKPFPSVELTDSYAGGGKVGVVGLAFTDKPASIATERLQFSRSAPGTVFAADSEAPAIEFETAPVDSGGMTAAITAAFSAVAARFSAKSDEKPKDEPKEALKTPANDNNRDFAGFATAIGEQMVVAIKPVADAQAAMQADFAALKAKVEQTEAPGTFGRKPATGGTGGQQTDW